MSDEGKLLPEIARDAVECRLLDRVIKPIEPEWILSQRAGVFVTIRTRAGRLRGCRGTIQPQFANVIQETRNLALSSAFQDPRFEPIRADELVELSYEVSVLHEPEPAESLADFDASRFGIIVTTPTGKRALMLPNVEGLETVEKQYSATCQKGGIDPAEEVRLERFQVDKFGA
jgi:AmmeMemoRadiSam system protein A